MRQAYPKEFHKGAATEGLPYNTMTLIKICGITNLEDAVAAINAGADALGFNFYKPSPRYITPQAAREIIGQIPDSVLTVGVFVNEESPDAVRKIAEESGIKALQLHGDESPDYCRQLSNVIKTFSVSTDFDTQQLEHYEVDAIMLDTKHKTLRGGTGHAFDWAIAQRVSNIIPKLYLAGGLSPENVAEAIETVRPYAVDACSSIEVQPGKKNHERMRVFIAVARNVKP